MLGHAGAGCLPLPGSNMAKTWGHIYRASPDTLGVLHMSGLTQATGVSAALQSGSGDLSTLKRVTEEARVGGRL